MNLDFIHVINNKGFNKPKSMYLFNILLNHNMFIYLQLSILNIYPYIINIIKHLLIQ
jgi:hypothetical protein